MTDTTATAPMFQPPAGPMYQASSQDDFDIDIRSLFLMLWRRKMVVLGCVLIGLSLSTIAMSFIKPRFEARSLMLIEVVPPSKNLEELQVFMGSLRLDTAFILSEIEIMKSGSFAEKVIKKLNLFVEPEFNSKFKQALARHEDKDAKPEQEADKEFKSLSIYGSELEAMPSGSTTREIADIIASFQRNLNIRSIPGSNVVQIEFTSTDPNKAALIANAVADGYIEQRLERKFAATKKVTDWLDERLKTLRGQVQAAEEAVASYKQKYKITQGAKSHTISEEQLSALNSQLVTAKAQRAQAQAKLAHVKEMAQNPDKIETTAEILNSSLIQGLKRDKATLESKLSELSGRYGPKHPELVKAKAELEEITSSIRKEILKSAKTIENEVMFADATVGALESGLSEYQGKQFEDNDASIGLAELERQAESTRLIYDTFLKTYKKTDDQDKLQSPEARIISFANAPKEPAYPNKMLILSLGGAISLFIGLAIAILIEKMDNTFRSASQIEKFIGYPCYALIPLLQNLPRKEVVDFIISKPASTLAESVRTLRLVLNLRSKKKPRCVTLTSSLPSEGKTTLSIWLSRLAAKSGEKVILIDADLRRPNVHRSLSKANDLTLVDYLTGQKNLEEVIQKDEASGLHMIFGRSVPNSALDLVSSEKMARLVSSLSQVYDLVIIDSPACLAVSDARVLAKISDQLLYVVAWDRTAREIVMSGVKQFSDMGCRDVAFALTNVDVKRHVRYGYGDTAYYYGRYKEYFSE